MYEDLFFLPLLARTLERPSTRSALPDALQRIHAMGQKPQYQRGYQQFLQFMESANDSLWEGSPEQVSSDISQATDRSLPGDIFIECDGRRVAACSLKDSTTVQIIGGLKPGLCHVRFETGLLLWHGVVTDEDVLWAKAFPGLPLEMAAETDEAKRRPTRTIDLPESGLVIRLYAGIETGFIEIEVNTAEAEK